jgi:hypothetical protein
MVSIGRKTESDLAHGPERLRGGVPQPLHLPTRTQTSDSRCLQILIKPTQRLLRRKTEVDKKLSETWGVPTAVTISISVFWNMTCVLSTLVDSFRSFPDSIQANVWITLSHLKVAKEEELKQSRDISCNNIKSQRIIHRENC